MTTYAEFQSYVIDFVWRKGDTDFATALPRLIRQGEARINRDAKITTQETRAVIPALTTSIVPRPVDYASLRTISVLGSAPACYITPADFDYRQVMTLNKPPFGHFYTIVGKNFELSGPVPTPDYSVSLAYYQKIIPYEDDPAEPFYDEYPDFYLAAVLIQCYSWLRNDAAAGDYENKFKTTLESMREDDAQQKYAGSPLAARLPGAVL